MKLKTGFNILLGTAIFAGAMALLMAITGNWGAFFGALVICLGMLALRWSGRLMLTEREEGTPRNAISRMILIVFGGAGFVMLAGSVALFFDDDFPAALAMLIFGSIFCAVAYIASRVFATPAGLKQVLVGKGTETIEGELGQKGQLTEKTYIYVDEKTTDDEIGKMQKQWTESPWTQRSDWAKGDAVQEGTFDMRLLTAFTAIWNIMSWGLAGYGIWSEWDSGDIPWFLLLFPLVGIAFIIMTVRTWIRKRKFGISLFHSKTMPFYLGDRLTGAVQTGVPVKNETMKEFSVRLVCVKKTTTIDQDGTERVNEERLWKHDESVIGGISAKAPTFQVPIKFDIPADLPPTALNPEDNRTLWRLEIKCKVKGVDYAAQFELPVYPK